MNLKMKRPSSPQVEALADQQTQERLEAIGWSPAQALCRQLVSRPDGSIFTFPRPAPEHIVRANEEALHEAQRLMAVNRVALLQRYIDMALPVIMADPEASQQFGLALARLHAQTQELAQRARRVLEQREREQAPREQGKFKRWFGGGTVTQLVGETVSIIKTAQQQYEDQKMHLLVDTYETVLTMIASAQEFTTRWGKQRTGLTTTITAASSLAQAEVAAWERIVATTDVPDDLPSGYLVRLAAALADELPELAHAQALHALSRTLAQAKEADQAVTAQQLYEEIQAGGTPTGETTISSLQATSTTVATGLKVEARHVWQALLEHLRQAAFAQTPTVALTKKVEREGQSYLFQIVPTGQAAVFASDRLEVRPAYFRADGPATRLGLMHVQTNFPLDAVLAVKALGPSGERAVAEANPFILPPFVECDVPLTDMTETSQGGSRDHHHVRAVPMEDGNHGPLKQPE